MRTALLLVAGLAFLTGCTERPEGIPSPRPGLFQGSQSCPDLTGAYALKTEGGGWSLGGEALTQALAKVPAYHSVLVIESVSEDQMVLRTQATQEDVRKAFVRWRNGEPYQYALWRYSLTARSNGDGILLERDDRKRPSPAKMFPATRTFEVSGVHYDCKRGWLEFKGEEEPDVTNLRWARVRMTRAQGGGVVAAAKYTFEQDFSLWCGDGCRPSIPLPDGHKKRWWHAPAVEDTGAAKIDWGRILEHDDRPSNIRNRYRDGTFLPYMRQKKTQEKEPEPLPPPPPPKPVAYDCPDQRQRVERITQPWLRITDFSCTDTHCSVKGTGRSNRAISDAIRALDEQGVKGVELELIEQRGADDIRFGFRVGRQKASEGPACQSLP